MSQLTRFLQLQFQVQLNVFFIRLGCLGTKICIYMGETSSGFLLASNQLTLLQAGVLPQSPKSLDGVPNTFRYGSTALASERIPNHMSTSRCAMTTLHLSRDDRGKENVASLPSVQCLDSNSRLALRYKFGLCNKDTMSLGSVALVHPTLLTFIKYYSNTYMDIQVPHTG